MVHAGLAPSTLKIARFCLTFPLALAALAVLRVDTNTAAVKILVIHIALGCQCIALVLECDESKPSRLGGILPFHADFRLFEGPEAGECGMPGDTKRWRLL